MYFIWTTSFDPPQYELTGSISMPPVEARVGGEAADAVTVEPFDEIVVRLAPTTGGIAAMWNNDPLAGVDDVKQRVAKVVALGVNPPVIIDPDPDIAMSDVIAFYDAARSGGADRVLFGVPQ